MLFSSQVSSKLFVFHLSFSNIFLKSLRKCLLFLRLFVDYKADCILITFFFYIFVYLFLKFDSSKLAHPLVSLFLSFLFLISFLKKNFVVWWLGSNIKKFIIGSVAINLISLWFLTFYIAYPKPTLSIGRKGF